jgi:hypothetical protein
VDTAFENFALLKTFMAGGCLFNSLGNPSAWQAVLIGNANISRLLHFY